MVSRRYVGVFILFVAAAPFLAFGQTCPSLSRGSTGPAVTRLQQFLQDAYKEFPSPTGYFGPLTEAAVKQWQKENGIVSGGTPATTGWGIVGPRTAAMMKLCGNTSTQSAPASASSTESRLAALRAELARLQALLASLVAAGGGGGGGIGSGAAASGGGGAVSTNLPSPAPWPVPPTPLPMPPPTPGITYAQYVTVLSALHSNRSTLWGTTFGEWEVWYDGYDSAADNVPMAFVWDNPIDDDGLEDFRAGRGFRLNTPSRGYMTVSRIGDEGKASVIHRRDEHLSNAAGFTLEFSVKIDAHSREDGFMAYYVDELGTSGIFLSPGHVKAGGYNQHRTAFDPSDVVPFNTTDAYHVYRLVQQPGSKIFSVYVDGVRIIDSQGSGNKPSSLSNHDRPYVILGGEPVGPTAFTLDYVRYRRGAYAPGESMPAPTKRSPPSLPPPRPANVTENFVTFPSANLGPIQFWNGGAQPNGPFRLTAGPTGTMNLRGVIDKGDVTIELRAKVAPSNGHRGFMLTFQDGMGSTALYLSPDKAEMSLGDKNVGFYSGIGFQTQYMDTTDKYHTYRFVRPANSLYAYLYMDDHPIPSLYDQHADGHMGIVFGGTPDPSITFGSGKNAADWRKSTNVDIEYIRWSPTAYAPPAPSATVQTNPACNTPEKPPAGAAPYISSSASAVRSGCPIEVAWDGGTNAFTCAVILTDATRTDFTLWSGVRTTGRVDALTSSTTYTLRCIDASGAFIPGTPVSTSVSVL